MGAPPQCDCIEGGKEQSTKKQRKPLKSGFLARCRIATLELLTGFEPFSLVVRFACTPHELWLRTVTQDCPLNASLLVFSSVTGSNSYMHYKRQPLWTVFYSGAIDGI